MEHTIDAQGKKLGRVASQAPVLLMGKNKATFKKSVYIPQKVKIINASKLQVSSKKLEDVSHVRYTGYPGGLIKERLALVVGRKGYRELVRHAIEGMIPANRTKKKIMKYLTVSE